MLTAESAEKPWHYVALHRLSCACQMTQKEVLSNPEQVGRYLREHPSVGIELVSGTARDPDTEPCPPPTQRPGDAS